MDIENNLSPPRENPIVLMHILPTPDRTSVVILLQSLQRISAEQTVASLRTMADQIEVRLSQQPGLVLPKKGIVTP